MNLKDGEQTVDDLKMNLSSLAVLGILFVINLIKSKDIKSILPQ